jgi:hypothetical protein
VHTVRRYTFPVLLGAAAGSGLALVAYHNHWSELGLYAGMAGLIFVLALFVALLEVRKRGPELFSERPRSSQSNPPRG